MEGEGASDDDENNNSTGDFTTMAIKLPPLCHLVLLALQCTFVLGQADFHTQSDIHYNKGDVETTIQKYNVTIQKYDPMDYGHRRSYDSGEVFGIIYGSVILTGAFLGCCFYFCCASCRNGKVQRGYVINSNAHVGSNTQQMPTMQQQAATPQYMSHQVPYTLQNQTAPTLQHIPPEHHISEFPPPYDTIAAQPQQNSNLQWQQQQHSPIRQERQYSPLHQQNPTQPSVNPAASATTSQPDPYMPVIRNLFNQDNKANEANFKY